MAIIKQPAEVMLVDFSCAGAALRPDEEITALLDISSVVLSGSGTLEFPTGPNSPAISGHVIQHLVAGGEHGSRYKVTILAETSASPVREFDFLVVVNDF